MGGLISIRYMEKHPGVFAATALTSPMVVPITKPLPKPIAEAIAKAGVAAGLAHHYAPTQKPPVINADPTQSTHSKSIDVTDL